MAGLVGYASSDEEDEQPQPEITAPEKTSTSSPHNGEIAEAATRTTKDEKASTIEEPPLKEPPGASKPPSDLPIGPSRPPPEQYRPNDALPDIDLLVPDPGSPYSSNRALLHRLTLPSVPDMDIPPSPPGSPPPATNKKFAQFLELKRKGVHFNAKIESSTALRNPGLMDKLLGFTGLDADPREQYESVVGGDLWDPKGFPEWAYRGKLRESREGLAREREAERAAGGRTAVDFVPATGSSGSGTNTPAGISKPGSKRKSGWK